MGDDTAVKLAPVRDSADKADGKPADDNERDDKTLALAPAASKEAHTDAQATTTPQAARVDAIAPRVIQAGYQTSQQQLNLSQLAFELVRQANDDNTRFQMRLYPLELGRIDVRLDIDKSGQINARLVVEKSETLDLMQRDQRALERALQQAGLDAGKTNLEFSLKQSPFSGGQHQTHRQSVPRQSHGQRR
ncbi:MAG: flagellar hook-length control protein FliK [Candidatus Devosia euplotis]|nr:flagellar hook-length control protein FliK [Candidatus Devosia euplotis]